MRWLKAALDHDRFHPTTEHSRQMKLAMEVGIDFAVTVTPDTATN